MAPGTGQGSKDRPWPGLGDPSPRAFPGLKPVLGLCGWGAQSDAPVACITLWVLPRHLINGKNVLRCRS